MAWISHHFNFKTKDIILLKLPYHLTPLVWEIFLPLCIGAQLIIAPNKAYLNPQNLIKLINQYHITTIQFVPSFYTNLLSKKKLRLAAHYRKFLWEQSLRSDTKKNFLNKMNCKLHNLYDQQKQQLKSHLIQ